MHYTQPEVRSPYRKCLRLQPFLYRFACCQTGINSLKNPTELYLQFDTSHLRVDNQPSSNMQLSSLLPLTLFATLVSVAALPVRLPQPGGESWTKREALVIADAGALAKDGPNSTTVGGVCFRFPTQLVTQLLTPTSRFSCAHTSIGPEHVVTKCILSIPASIWAPTGI
jgi:hypothetical protein